ncbi:MAG: tetratricopeptide repeat protein, partial [Myxococcota bacterium]
GGLAIDARFEKAPIGDLLSFIVGDAAVPAEASLAPAPAPPTAEQKKRYRHHLATGRRLSGERKWGEATRAFQAALEAIPMDGRALSELGWAAFQAGDYPLARTANRDAVRAATDPRVRAASLYNLGRVAEAAGERDEAAGHYRASLALRPNRTVERRLAGLDRAVPAAGAVEYPRCGPTRSIDELCACVVAAIGTVGPDEKLECVREPRQVAGVELLLVGDEVEEWVHLIAESASGWSTVAMLGYVYSPEKFGIHEEFEVARMELRQVAERTVLWIETVQTRTDIDEAEDATESSRVRKLTLCVRSPGQGQGIAGCALQVPLVDSYQRTPRAGAGGKPVRTVRRLDIELRETGSAKVVLIEGDKSDEVAPLLGEHRLW